MTRLERWTKERRTSAFFSPSQIPHVAEFEERHWAYLRKVKPLDGTGTPSLYDMILISRELIFERKSSQITGGGVFRGIYHIGVTNALNEMKLSPDLVAGSSVGSIIAAMIATAFKDPSAENRKKQILDVAPHFSRSIDLFSQIGWRTSSGS